MLSEIEGLEIIIAIKLCRPYVQSSHFVLYLDHQALKWAMDINGPSGRLMR